MNSSPSVVGDTPDLSGCSHATRRTMAELVAQVAGRGTITTDRAADWLRAVHLTADDGALEQAVDASRRLLGYVCGDDPFLDGDFPPGTPYDRARQVKVEEQERLLAEAVEILAQPAVMAGAR